MNEKELARELLPQLQAIARDGGFTWLTRIELLIGSLYGVASGPLVAELEQLFEDTDFEDVIVEVTLVEPQQEIKAPRLDALMTASGWELLVANIEGTQG